MNSIVICGLYYVAWIYVLPRFGKYSIRQEIIVLEDGAQTHSLVKIPLSQLDEWEATHDAAGRKLDADSGSDIHGTSNTTIEGEKA